MLRDHVESIDPAGTGGSFAARTVGPDYCNAGRRGRGRWLGRAGPGSRSSVLISPREREIQRRDNRRPDTIFRDGQYDFGARDISFPFVPVARRAVARRETPPVCLIEIRWVTRGPNETE